MQTNVQYVLGLHRTRNDWIEAGVTRPHQMAWHHRHRVNNESNKPRGALVAGEAGLA